MRRFFSAVAALGGLFLFAFQGQAFELPSPSESLEETTTETSVMAESLGGGEGTCDQSCDSCCDPGLFGGLIKPTRAP